MDTDAFKTNLNTVKELILDEHKVVTYISLSKELCIHVNEAKSLLYQFIQDVRQNRQGTDLHVCYMLSGLLGDNNGCTTVCSEKDLDSLKKSLKLVFYEHVYCVSQGLKSVDRVVLSALNKFEDLPLCTGLIKAKSCNKWTGDKLANLVSKNQLSIVDPKSNTVQQKKSNKNVTESTKNPQENATAVSVIKSECKVKSEVSSPKKGISSSNKTSPRKNGNKTSTKGIAGFFNKANGASTKAKTTVVKKVEPDVENAVKVKVEPSDTNSIISSKVNKQASLKTNESASKNNSLTQIKNNAKVDKKRKRLLRVSDSESETEENDPFSNEMDVDHESEDEIPPTPTINTVKITSGIVNPKKRRKIVDKTYTDEEGYILTKKEEVYESYSENDEETKENEEVKVNSMKITKAIKHTNENTEVMNIVTSPKENKRKKVSPPQKGRQATINSFFKKV